jgi:hypothetical protein
MIFPRPRPFNFDGFILSPKIVISNDLNLWLKSLCSENSDRLQIHLFMKTEEPIEYSYFIFGMIWKDHICLATDMINFGNPRDYV